MGVGDWRNTVIERFDCQPILNQTFHFSYWSIKMDRIYGYAFRVFLIALMGTFVLFVALMIDNRMDTWEHMKAGKLSPVSLPVPRLPWEHTVKVIETEHIETETIKLNWSFGNYRVSERMKMATVNVIRNEDGYQTIYVISPPRLGWVCCNDSGTDFIQVKTMGEGEYETMANQSLGTPSHLDTRGVR